MARPGSDAQVCARGATATGLEKSRLAGVRALASYSLLGALEPG